MNEIITLISCLSDKTLASKVIVNFLRDSQTTDIEFTTFHHWIKNNLKILLSN